MPAMTKLSPTIPLEKISTITVVSSDHFLIFGRDFYTREGYLSKLGLSATSVQIPYAHVIWGKADLVRISSLSLFSPIEADTDMESPNKGLGRASK